MQKIIAIINQKDEVGNTTNIYHLFTQPNLLTNHHLATMILSPLVRNSHLVFDSGSG